MRPSHQAKPGTSWDVMNAEKTTWQPLAEVWAKVQSDAQCLHMSVAYICLTVTESVFFLRWLTQIGERGHFHNADCMAYTNW